jgi:hypothetical protein
MYGEYRGRRALNPVLYGLLQERFGQVLIANEGEAAQFGDPVYDPSRGKFHTPLIFKGEYYKLPCPYCDDTRYRLYVHHLFHTDDPLTGRPMRHLAVCFNNDCLKTRYRDFEERLFMQISMQEREALRRKHADRAYAARGLPVGPVPMPEKVVSLRSLRPDHRAVSYLVGRGFDLDELDDNWVARYCVGASGVHAQAAERIIAPIYFDGECVGWQGRWPADLDWKSAKIPKYYTPRGFTKSRYVYNYDLARRHRIMVVCEGVTDVWAVGREAVALLGKTVSGAQKELLGAWARRTQGLLVLMLDPDAWKVPEGQHPEHVAAKHRDLLYELRRATGGRLVEVELPDGQDPAALGREAVWAEIRRAAGTAGYRLEDYRPQ